MISGRLKYYLLPIGILSMALFLAVSCLGQSLGGKGVITGRVFDEDNLAIPGVSIRVGKLDNGSVSDVEGNFRIDGLNPGTYTLTFTGLGYLPFSKSVKITASGGNTQMEVKLSMRSTMIGEVVIESISEREATEISPFSVQAIAIKPLKERNLDVSQVLNQVPGIRVRQEAGLGSKFTFSLNGLSGRQVKFFIDGVPMDYMGSTFSINNFPVNLIERVAVYKGVVPIELGSDALGGAVSMVTDQKTPQYLDISYGFGSFNTHRFSINSRYQIQNSGLTFEARGFFNYSDNNYTMRNMDVFVDGEQQEIDVERFHDEYSSYYGSMGIGLLNKKWADRLMVTAIAGGLDQEIQNGFYGIPVGEADTEEENNIYSVHYKKSGLLNPKLDIELFGQLASVNSITRDTSSHRYDWTGKIARTENNSLGELVRQKTIFEYEQKSSLIRSFVSYDFNKTHKVSVNNVWSYAERQGENRLGVSEQEPFSNPNTLRKNVLGLAYENNFLDDKITSILSLKHYKFDILAKEVIEYTGGEFAIEDIQTSQNRFGVSLAGRYYLNPLFFIKVSYEKGYRIPEPREIFGDGLRIITNPELKPEASDNFNLGLNYQPEIGSQNLILQSNFFIRDAENYIFLQQDGVFSQYRNILNVLVRGGEIDARYLKPDKFSIGINATWQQVLNNQKYVLGTTTQSRVYRDQMPNTPYLFGNADFNYDFNLKNEKFDLAGFYSINYVYEFFLNYPSTSRQETKNIIPSQLLNNIGASLSTADDRHVLSAEVRNIFNTEAFDNFRMPKPGRAFYLKYKLFID